MEKKCQVFISRSKLESAPTTTFEALLDMLEYDSATIEGWERKEGGWALNLEGFCREPRWKHMGIPFKMLD